MLTGRLAALQGDGKRRDRHGCRTRREQVQSVDGAAQARRKRKQVFLISEGWLSLAVERKLPE